MSNTGKNIVLDIDATLVHTHGELDNFKMLKVYDPKTQMNLRRKVYSMVLIDVSTNPGEGEVTELSGIYRPYLKDFLEFCFQYFDNVVIWSAGKKKYVEKMCEFMFPLNSAVGSITTDLATIFPLKFPAITTWPSFDSNCPSIRRFLLM